MIFYIIWKFIKYFTSIKNLHLESVNYVENEIRNGISNQVILTYHILTIHLIDPIFLNHPKLDAYVSEQIES